MKKFVIISKDAMCTDYLPVYGNKYWKTPNIDEIVKNGTVFKRHYTAAPSTVMSFYSMITGNYSHESEFEVYEKSYKTYQGETLFRKLRAIGFSCHILWANNMMPLKEYLDYFKDDVELHSTDVFRQGVGAHYIHDGFLMRNPLKAEEAFVEFSRVLEGILSRSDDIFLWVHFPHVIKGEVSYGSDIELFDRYVGKIRELVSDDSIVITADHGNMNGRKGKLGYGFDVYEPNIRVPFITPRINELKEVNYPTSSLDLFNILFTSTIPKRKYIYSDSAFRAQPNRKLAIIKDKYKYIYNKRTKEEELYDLEYDPREEISLIDDYIFDVDRKIKVPARELYYYPFWDSLPQIRDELRHEKDRIWKNGSIRLTAVCTIKDILRPLYERVSKVKNG